MQLRTDSAIRSFRVVGTINKSFRPKSLVSESLVIKSLLLARVARVVLNQL